MKVRDEAETLMLDAISHAQSALASLEKLAMPGGAQTWGGRRIEHLEHLQHDVLDGIQAVYRANYEK